MALVLEWTEAEVMEAVNDLRLVMLRTDDGAYLFPSFHLQEGKTGEGLQDVLRVLRTGVNDSGTWAQWLNVALPEDTRPATSHSSTNGASRMRYEPRCLVVEVISAARTPPTRQ